ncbi:hypothetical protein SCE1572_33635 [Sorangium cellulosum So0157-2]|uniref:Multiple EGF-like-domain protein 3 n=1 Tax=Sorangium cellulosum So0157-2 TaxID=1254432 RepID=S4Y3I1_SORCE|nr:hypothetical protein SCE1572_33635 [Sorangium cellulosum So0157-2]
MLALSATAGCGDDGGEGGKGGSGGAGGAGVTGSGAGASGATSTGSSGGAEPTGTGGGGGTPVNYGAACTYDAACDGEYCIRETDWGWPSGACAGLCDPIVGACDDGGVCVDFGDLGLCIRRCSTTDECRDGYTCSDIGGEITACIPACTENAQCAELGLCDRFDGLCKLGELDCSDGEDDEGDGQVDCADGDCAATCRPLVDAACAGAAAVTTTIEGDTSSGTRVLHGSCTGAGPEEIHVFTPPAGQSGTLLVVLQSEGNHGLYTRAACADASTEIACEDEHVASGAEEELEVVVHKDQAVPIVVDARTPADAGPYTLDLVFSPATCGDGIVSKPEECDDGNTVDGDGCSAACTLEIDDVCADAPVAVLGGNAGDTTGGTAVFEGTCTGRGTPERLHAFTPPSDGTLRLVLSSETDQGFYVRTGCSGRQLACVESEIAGRDERRSIDVEGGVPLLIFVEAYHLTDVGPYTLRLSFTPSP